MSLNITQTWYIIAAICGLLLCMSVFSYRRSNLTAAPAKKMALVALRIVALAAVLFLLLDPHDVRKETFREKMNGPDKLQDLIGKIVPILREFKNLKEMTVSHFGRRGIIIRKTIFGT